MLTVLTLFSALVLTRIILVPVRPSRENVISMPSVRRNVCARRSRPASRPRIFCPWYAAQNVSAGMLRTQAREFGRASGPHGPVDHQGTHTSGYRIRLDDTLDGGCAVCRVSRSHTAEREKNGEQSIGRSRGGTTVKLMLRPGRPMI